MDRNDREAIESLFGKLASVERSSPPRDSQSETLIRDKIAAQPAAPYYMAQTIIVQEQALAAAEQRIAELESQESGGRGGLFGSLFGDGRGSTRPADRGTGSVPRVGREAQEPQQGGSGFLAGAAQTALGVTGGVLLGNAIAGMFGSGKAEAAEKEDAKDHSSQDNRESEDDRDSHDDEPEFEEVGYDDGGGDFGDF
jgi:hypothetical protein